MKPFSSAILISSAVCVLFAAAAHASSHNDSIIVLDEGAADVILIQMGSSTQEVLWSGAPLERPTDAVLEANGRWVLIADPDANTIFRFDWVAAPAPEPLAILGLDFLPAGSSV